MTKKTVLKNSIVDVAATLGVIGDLFPTYRKARKKKVVKRNPAARSRIAKKGAYWAITAHDGYVSFRTDSGHTGSTPYANIPGGKGPMGKAHAFAKWNGLTRKEYEILDATTKRNPANRKSRHGAHKTRRLKPGEDIRGPYVGVLQSRNGVTWVHIAGFTGETLKLAHDRAKQYARAMYRQNPHNGYRTKTY